MAEIRVVHPRFEKKILAVRTGTLAAPKLLLDGRVLERVKGAFSAPDDSEKPVTMRLKAGLDPIPKVEIDGAIVKIAPALAWYEYAWAGWPIVLVGFGGALGGALGAVAATVNLNLMRSDIAPPARYAVTAVISISAVVAYVMIAALVFGGTR